MVDGGGSGYYLSDGLGSVVGLTGGSGGEPLSYTYSPYGVSTPSATQGVPQNQLQFTGALQDNASNPDGIDHMGARFYDPTIGRWTQQDPIFNPASRQGWDRYVYVGDDPVNYTDPAGRQNADTVVSMVLGVVGWAFGAVAGVTATAFPNRCPCARFGLARNGAPAVAAGVGGCAIGSVIGYGLRIIAGDVYYA